MSGRARRRAVLVGVLLAAIGPVGPARAAADGGGPGRSRATQDGWWNRLQGPADREPDGNPVRPLVPPMPASPTVPADSIAAGAAGGQVDKVAAVAIDLALADGVTVGGLTLRLRESPAGGANVGADQAKVTACPATAAWGPNRNGAWRDRPVADCSVGSAEGIRAPDGTWTFDLTAFGRLWTDPVALLARNGVVLAVDPAGAPSPVQVSWLDVETGNVAVDLTGAPARPATGDRASGPTGTGVAGVGPVGTGAGGAGHGEAWGEGAAGFVAAGALGTLAPAASDQPAVAVAVAATPASAASGPGIAGPPPGRSGGAESAPAASAGRAGTVLRARPAVGFWERIPVPAALLLPVAVGLAVLVGLVLGPLGRPAPVFRREGGLSRALARRSAGAGRTA